MCSSKPLDIVTMIASPALGTAYVMQKKQQEKLADAQNKAQSAQSAKEAELRKQAEAIGPGAKSMDLTQDASVYQQTKKSKIAMQQGILGTMKTNALNAAPVATQKATLGT